MVLRHSGGLEKEAAAIEKAVLDVLNAGHRTADLARTSDSPHSICSTTQMGKLVHQSLTEAIDRRQSMHAV